MSGPLLFPKDYTSLYNYTSIIANSSYNKDNYEPLVYAHYP
jgi:hypothetical protein